MSISTTTRKAGPYVGTGAVSSFVFRFKVFSVSDVVVVRTTAAGVKSTLVMGADYTVNLNSDQTEYPGGSVVTPVPLPLGSAILITSSIALLQPAKLTNLGAFYPKVIEDALDRIVIMIQEIAGSGALIANQESQTAIAGQTAFTLANSYAPGTNSLAVYCDGLRLLPNVDYTETSATTVTLVNARSAGDEMFFVTGKESSSTGGPASAPTASEVPFAPTSPLLSTDVQSAISESYTKAVSAMSGTSSFPMINAKAAPYSAVGDGVADDTIALQSALDAAMGRTAFLPKGIYKISSTLRLRKNGARLIGEADGGYTFGGVTDSGAVLKWTGVGSGVVLAVEPNGSSYDLHGVAVENIQIDGNATAGALFSVKATDHSSFRNITLQNPQNGAGNSALVLGALAHAFSPINCCYRNEFSNIVISVPGSTAGVALDGSGYAGENTTFCVFSNIHVTHENGPAFYLRDCDDNTFFNIAASRLAGGTGYAVQLDGTSSDNRYAVGNTFYGVQCGTGDASRSGIYSAGVKARQNKLYGVSGVDDSPTFTIISGSQLWYDFLGTGYGGSDASEGAHVRTAPLKITNYSNSDANTLDWYEEGNFIPALRFGGAQYGMSYAAGLNNGKFTRIGNVVNFSIDIGLSSKGVSAGAATISGLPYASTTQNNTPATLFLDAMNTGGWVDNPTAYIAGGSATIYLSSFSPATGVVGYFYDGHFTNTSRLTISGTYLVD